MWKVRAFVLGLVIAGLWGNPVSAQDHFVFAAPPVGAVMMGDGPGMMFPLLLNKLDLTPEQHARVGEIKESHHGRIRSLFKQLEAAHEELTDKFFAPGELNTAEVASQAQNVKQLREQLMDEGMRTAVEIREILTPEQLTKAAQLKAKMQAMHSQMRGLFDEEE